MCTENLIGTLILAAIDIETYTSSINITDTALSIQNQESGTAIIFMVDKAH